MTLKVDFLGFAEGAVFDARGSLTLVGFSPQALGVESFPGAVAINVILMVEEDDEDAAERFLFEGAKSLVRLQLAGPSGEVLFLAEQPAPLQQVQRPGQFPRLVMIAQVPFQATKEGKYLFRVDVTIENASRETQSVSAEKAIRVIEQTK